MLWLYRAIYLPFFLLMLPRTLSRMVRRGGYREDWQHRFGRLPCLPPKAANKKRVWIQAVSVGELLAIEPLLNALQKSPQFEVFLSTTTTTGYQIIKDRLADRTLAHGYFPFDFWPLSRTAWTRIAPDLVLLTESELWPEHLHQASQRGVPVLLINGRLSDKSFSRYLRIRPLAERILRMLTHLALTSEEDKRRYQALGAIEDRLSVTGNLKLDLPDEVEISVHERLKLRAELGFGPTDRVVLGSSTWTGEELLLANWLRTLNRPDVRLLIVPRHAERTDSIRSELKACGHICHFRSEGRQAPRTGAIYIADTTGELRMLTQIADLAYIGKSLPPHRGGQSPIDAAMAGIPIVTGPNMQNFRSIMAGLEAAGIAQSVPESDSVGPALKNLLEDSARRDTVKTLAHHWRLANRGSLQRTLQLIQKFSQ